MTSLGKPVTQRQLRVGEMIKQSLGMKKNESFGEFGIHNSVDFEGKKVIGIETFMKREKIRVTGRTTGKGFSGNQKRHNFHRGPMTHGSKNHRLLGSIGAGTTPGKVFPGKILTLCAIIDP